ncbi:hypothetical protein JCM8547_005477 [Rhodosporidiobolus lusitaniae]
MPVEFHQGRVGRPPEGGSVPLCGLDDRAPFLLANETRGASSISPDDLLRFLDDLTPRQPSSSSSSSSSSADHHLFTSGSTSTPYTTPAATSFQDSASGPSPSLANAFGLASLFPSSSFSNKGEVAFAASAKPFDAGDIALPFDLDTTLPSVSSADVFAFPVLNTTTSSMPLDPLTFDASLESPLGLAAAGSTSTSPLSEFLASPMFSLPPSAAPSTTFSELPLPSPPADSTTTALPWFPPLPSADAISLDLTYLQPSPPLPTPALPVVETSTSKRSRKPAPTGFRRDTSTPLLAMDAPIQSRNSVIPSATSRKRKTAAAEKALAKRRKSRDEVPSPAPPPAAPAGEDDLPAEIVAAVERKRLQNTLSARKSRARKQARLQELEDENEALRRRVEELERMMGLSPSA